MTPLLKHTASFQQISHLQAKNCEQQASDPLDPQRFSGLNEWKLWASGDPHPRSPGARLQGGQRPRKDWDLLARKDSAGVHCGWYWE